MGIGIFLFLSIATFCTYGFANPEKTPSQLLVIACVALAFLIYIAIDLLKIFSLEITEKGIEKKSLVFKTKRHIPFTSILSIGKQKIRSRNTRGYISDGFTVSVLKLKNGENLIISPDSFENYQEIIEAIELNLQ